jgi:hypothetical protein
MLRFSFEAAQAMVLGTFLTVAADQLAIPPLFPKGHAHLQAGKLISNVADGPTSDGISSLAPSLVKPPASMVPSCDTSY